LSKYEFKKAKFQHEDLLSKIQTAIGRLPNSYEVSYDSEGNIAEFTLTFDPPLTSTEETDLQNSFPELKMTKVS